MACCSRQAEIRAVGDGDHLSVTVGTRKYAAQVYEHLSVVGIESREVEECCRVPARVSITPRQSHAQASRQPVGARGCV